MSNVLFPEQFPFHFVRGVNKATKRICLASVVFHLSFYFVSCIQYRVINALILIR